MILAPARRMDRTEYVSYSPCKIDSQVLPLAKAAAALKSIHVQEWLSNIVNEAAAKELGMKPIKRRAVRPKPPTDA